MTYLEIDKAIVAITREKCTECKARLDKISKENGTERKAVQLEHGMYTFFGNAGLLFNTQWERDRVIRIRQQFLNNELHKYPELNNAYKGFDEEEKLRFIAALQAEIFIRDQWLGTQHDELSAAEESGEIKKAFDLKIKIGAAENMFAAWESWRVENGVYSNMLKEMTR